jgi:hypothetical protein
MKSTGKIIVFPAIFLVVVVMVAMYFVSQPPKGYIFYYPEKYAGWICIHHGVGGAEKLAEINGYLIAKNPPTGVLKTSSLLRTSKRRNKYYYYHGATIRKAEELEFGGGGTVQQKMSDGTLGPVMSFMWISTDAERDYELYVKGRTNDPVPCGPFAK